MFESLPSDLASEGQAVVGRLASAEERTSTHTGVRRLGFGLLAFSLLVVPSIAALSLRAQPGSVASAASLAPTPPPMPVRLDVGPGPVTAVLRKQGYRLELSVSPNRLGSRQRISIELEKAGRAVDRARIIVSFTSLEMAMGALTGHLPQVAHGRYANQGPVLTMLGRWRLRIEVVPKGERAFDVSVVDRIAT